MRCRGSPCGNTGSPVSPALVPVSPDSLELPEPPEPDDSEPDEPVDANSGSSSIARSSPGPGVDGTIRGDGSTVVNSSIASPLAASADCPTYSSITSCCSNFPPFTSGSGNSRKLLPCRPGRVNTANFPVGEMSRSAGLAGRSITVNTPLARSVTASHGEPSTRARAMPSLATTCTSSVSGSMPGSPTTGSSNGLPTAPRSENTITLTPAAVITHARLMSVANTISRGCAPTVIECVTPLASASTVSSWSLPGPSCSGPSMS